MVLVASASDDKTVWLWDLATGAALQTLKGNPDWVKAETFSPDGKLVISASGGSVHVPGDYAIRLWDSATGAALQTLRAHSARSTL
jgi:WD40 repeat protein